MLVLQRGSRIIYKKHLVCVCVCVCADKTGARTFTKLRRQRCDVRCAFSLARVLWPPSPTLEIYINRKIMPQWKWLCLLHVRTLHTHILAEHHTFSLPAEKVLFFLSAERKNLSICQLCFVCCVVVPANCKMYGWNSSAWKFVICWCLPWKKYEKKELSLQSF